MRRRHLAVLALSAIAACSSPRKHVAPIAHSAETPQEVVHYGERLVGPAKASPFVLEAMADTASVLTEMTGRPFAVAPAGSNGIALLKATEPGVPPEEAKRIADAGPEAFLIRADDTQLRIVANADRGLVNGLYFYLRELGCRWFMPGEDWSVVPHRPSIGVHLDRVVSPAFRLRTFFGTGQFGPATPVDPKGAAQRKWDVWKRRNGFGGEYLIQGHAGEAFAARNRAVLEAHPEYLAQRGGKRMPWSPSAGYCVSNPEFVKLYVADRLNELRRRVKANPAAPDAFAVSVEPADSGAHCECDRCRAIGKGTESDQVFYLANEVAKAVAKELPGRYVSLLGYSQHAAPPSFPIEPNVFVLAVPDAYQNTGLAPDALLRAWKERVKRLGVYTYWSPPDWGSDLPEFRWQSLSPRLRRYRELGVEAVSVETSYGEGAVGPALYVAGRLLWDPDADATALHREYVTASFGPAAPVMDRLFERWTTRFTPTPYELGLSYRDLAEARRIAQSEGADPAVLRRIGRYEAYLHYVRLWLEFRGPAKDRDERLEKTRRLLAWMYRTYDGGMVATARMRDLVVNRLARDLALGPEFAPANPNAPGWSTATKPVDEGELAGLMADGARQYAVANVVEPKTYSTRLVRPPALATAPLAPPIGALSLAGQVDFDMEVSPDRPLELDIAIRKHPALKDEGVTVSTPDGKVLHEERVPADGNAHSLKVPVPAPGRYRVHVEDQKAQFSVAAPAGTPFVLRQFISTGLSPRMYFWVPRGLQRVALYVPSVTPVEILDGDGHRVESAGSGMIVVDVPKGQDGRAWSLLRYKSWEPVRAINIPGLFAFSPETLLIPEDAAPR